MYESRSEQVETVTSFIQAGLDAGERCLYAYADNSRADVVKFLDDAGIDVEAAQEMDRLRLLEAESVYYDDGSFDATTMIEQLRTFIQEANAASTCTGLRTTAELSFLATADISLKEFLEYEARVNEAIYDEHDVPSLCQYTADSFSDEVLDGVMRTHPQFASHGVPTENDHYQPPAQYTGPKADAETTNRLRALDRQATTQKQALRVHHAFDQFTAATETLEDASKTEIADVAARLSGELADCAAAAGVWLFDRTADDLALAATWPPDSQASERLIEPFENRAWQAFIENEPRVLELDHTETPGQQPALDRGAFIPIDNHGVAAVLTDDDAALTDRETDMLEAVAAQAKLSLSRVTHERALDSRESKLERKTERLQRLNRINTISRQITQALVRASTEEEIRETVCERLTSMQLIDFAWVGDVNKLNDQLVPEEWAGQGRGYLDDVSLALDATGDCEPTVRATREEEPVVVSDTVARLRQESWRSAALSRDFHSMISVPLVYDDIQYGVLACYSTQSSTFGDISSVLTELGESMAYAFNSVERKKALVADKMVELVFELYDTQSPTLRLASEAGCTLELEGLVPRMPDRTVAFFELRGASVSELAAAAENSVAVTDFRSLEEAGASNTVQIEFQEPFIATVLAKHGAELTALTVDESSATATVEFPHSVGVRSIVDVVSMTSPDSELVSKHVQNRPTGAGESFDPPDSLTDRQWEVLRTAFYAGYFDQPRKSGGEEIADTLGITPSTFHQHRRSSIRRLLAPLLDD